MAVRKTSGTNETQVWHKMPMPVVNSYHAEWWKDYNRQRQMMAFGKVPEIVVAYDADFAETESAIIV
jgi:hypothetical protein